MDEFRGLSGARLLTATLFLLSGTLNAAPALSAQAGVFWCTFVDQQGGHRTHYVNDNMIPADSMHKAEITHAWSEYVRATYAPNSSTTIGPCGTVIGDPAQTTTQMEQRWTQAGDTVTHVHWAYSPQAEVAPATPATGGAGGTPGHRRSDLPIVPEPAATSPTTTTQHRISALPSVSESPAAPPATPVASVTHAPPSAAVAQAAESTAATRAAAAGKAYRCIFTFHEGTQTMRYSGGPIVTEAAGPALTSEWEKFIDAKYHPADPHRRGGCVQLSGRPDNWGRAVSSYEQNSNHLGVSTTHVDWSAAPKE
jgi:hypothetical protein